MFLLFRNNLISSKQSTNLCKTFPRLNQRTLLYIKGSYCTTSLLRLTILEIFFYFVFVRAIKIFKRATCGTRAIGSPSLA